MHSTFRPLVGALLALAPALAAAQPGPGAPMGGPMGGPAGRGPGAGGGFAAMLLAHVAELKLTDQQVTRLAAVARRSADQRTAAFSRADSLRRRPLAAAAEPEQQRERMQRDSTMRAMMEQVQNQERTSRRDALAVLTTDQVAQVFELRGPGGGVGDRRAMRGPRAGRALRGERGDRGVRGDRGPRRGPAMQGDDRGPDDRPQPGPRRPVRRPSE